MLQDLCNYASQSYSIKLLDQTDTGAHSKQRFESWITTTIFGAFRYNLLFTIRSLHTAALALRDQFVCLFLFSKQHSEIVKYKNIEVIWEEKKNRKEWTVRKENMPVLSHCEDMAASCSCLLWRRGIHNKHICQCKRLGGETQAHAA